MFFVLVLRNSCNLSQTVKTWSSAFIGPVCKKLGGVFRQIFLIRVTYNSFSDCLVIVSQHEEVQFYTLPRPILNEVHLKIIN